MTTRLLPKRAQLYSDAFDWKFVSCVTWECSRHTAFCLVSKPLHRTLNVLRTTEPPNGDFAAFTLTKSATTDSSPLFAAFEARPFLTAIGNCSANCATETLPVAVSAQGASLKM